MEKKIVNANHGTKRKLLAPLGSPEKRLKPACSVCGLWTNPDDCLTCPYPACRALVHNTATRDCVPSLVTRRGATDTEVQCKVCQEWWNVVDVKENNQEIALPSSSVAAHQKEKEITRHHYYPCHQCNLRINTTLCHACQKYWCTSCRRQYISTLTPPSSKFVESWRKVEGNCKHPLSCCPDPECNFVTCNFCYGRAATPLKDQVMRIKLAELVAKYPAVAMSDESSSTSSSASSSSSSSSNSSQGSKSSSANNPSATPIASLRTTFQADDDTLTQLEQQTRQLEAKLKEGIQQQVRMRCASTIKFADHIISRMENLHQCLREADEKDGASYTASELARQWKMVANNQLALDAAKELISGATKLRSAFNSALPLPSSSSSSHESNTVDIADDPPQNDEIKVSSSSSSTSSDTSDTMSAAPAAVAEAELLPTPPSAPAISPILSSPSHATQITPTSRSIGDSEVQLIRPSIIPREEVQAATPAITIRHTQAPPSTQLHLSNSRGSNSASTQYHHPSSATSSYPQRLPSSVYSSSYPQSQASPYAAVHPSYPWIRQPAALRSPRNVPSANGSTNPFPPSAGTSASASVASYPTVSNDTNSVASMLMMVANGLTSSTSNT